METKTHMRDFIEYKVFNIWVQ